MQNSRCKHRPETTLDGFIARVPVLIGAGIPLFGPLTRDIALEHVATRHYPSGLVQSEYLVLL